VGLTVALAGIIIDKSIPWKEGTYASCRISENVWKDRPNY